jgi:hypothetical protein
MLLAGAPEEEKNRWCNEAFTAILQEDEKAVPKADGLVMRVRSVIGA